MKRSLAWRLASASLALVLAVPLGGCVIGRARSSVPLKAGAGGDGSETSPKPAASKIATAPAPRYRSISNAHFGSSRMSWHRYVWSITVRGDELVVAVRNPLTWREAMSLVDAAKVANAKYRLGCVRVLITLYADGYVYGSYDL